MLERLFLVSLLRRDTYETTRTDPISHRSVRSIERSKSEDLLSKKRMSKTERCGAIVHDGRLEHNWRVLSLRVGSVGQIRSGLPGHSSARPSVLSFPPSSPRRHSPVQLPPYSSRLLSSTARNAPRPPLIQIEFSTRV